MLAELVTVGDELCRGEILDTNAHWLATQLWERQITTAFMSSCRDVREDMVDVLQRASERADLVLVSGGLGPTLDDLTVDVAAELAGSEPEVVEASVEAAKKRFAHVSMPPVDNFIRQMRAPAGARVFVNPVGLAPGFEIKLGKAAVICLPGPPRELKGIFKAHLETRIDELRRARGEEVEHLARRRYRVFGKGESRIAARLEDMTLDEGVSLHYQVSFPETLVKVVVRRKEQGDAERVLEALDGEIRQRLGWLVYGVEETSLAEVVGRELEAQGQTLATAESCTGGLIGSLITAIAGSSAYFVGGAVTYSNEEKMRQLGVQEATLIAHGAVSEEVVLEMAAGVRDRSGASYGLSVSGVAGPGGGTEAKPVGTVWVGVAGPEGRLYAKKFHWPGERNRVRILAAHWALSSLRYVMQQSGDTSGKDES